MLLYSQRLFLFISCESSDNIIDDKSKIEAVTLENLHHDFKGKLIAANELMQNEPATFDDAVLEAKFSENVTCLEENGIKSLFNKNNFDEKFVTGFEFYQNNKSNNDVYQLLIDNNYGTSMEEATFLFNLIEVHNLVKSELEFKNHQLLSTQQIERYLGVALWRLLALSQLQQVQHL